MFRRLHIVVLIAVLTMGCGSCGQSDVPSPSDPWTGKVGNMLVSEYEDMNGQVESFWIGFNSATAWSQAQTQLGSSTSKVLFIGGKMIPSSKTGVGFYFDPDSTTTAEALIPEWIRPIDIIAANPEKYASTSPDPTSTAPNRYWYVVVHVERSVSQ